MARCKFLVVLSFAFFVAVTSVAQATAIDPEQAAKQAYARGAELFKNRHFTEAAAAFEEGNQLKPHPAFSYNLALTYRALGQPAKAIEYYESYLRDSPQATDRASVEAAIAEERLKLPTARAAKSDSGAEGTPFYKKWWFWTASGAAVVALGVGLGVGLSRPTTASYREVTWQ
ncbi:MAG: hypothetical protein JNM83_16695 [Myxococcales bacterium]|jgi:tetratricopeptide (TPR) repeat protein|nr:hypothetical protein [Myxococcales bacterium]